MKTIRKYWPYILVAVLAAAIPVWALFVDPAGGTAASTGDEQFEKGILKRTDNQGSVWTLQKASGPSALSFRKPGSPLTVQTKVRRLNSGMALIELVLEGRAGETYRPTAKQNNSPLSVPWLRIVDKQGKTIGEGDFEYG